MANKTASVTSRVQAIEVNMTEHEDPGLKIEDSLMDAVCASARSHGKTNFLESFYTVDPDSLGASRLPWSNRVLQTSV